MKYVIWFANWKPSMTPSLPISLEQLYILNEYLSTTFYWFPLLIMKYICKVKKCSFIKNVSKYYQDFTRLYHTVCPGCEVLTICMHLYKLFFRGLQYFFYNSLCTYCTTKIRVNQNIVNLVVWELVWVPAYNTNYFRRSQSWINQISIIDSNLSHEYHIGISMWR